MKCRKHEKGRKGEEREEKNHGSEKTPGGGMMESS